MSFWHVLWEEEAVKKERIKIGVATIRRADFPAAPAAVQKELLKEFGEISGDKVNPEQKSFLDNIKNLFK